MEKLTSKLIISSLIFCLIVNIILNFIQFYFTNNNITLFLINNINESGNSLSISASLVLSTLLSCPHILFIYFANGKKKKTIILFLIQTILFFIVSIDQQIIFIDVDVLILISILVVMISQIVYLKDESNSIFKSIFLSILISGTFVSDFYNLNLEYTFIQHLLFNIDTIIFNIISFSGYILLFYLITETNVDVFTIAKNNLFSKTQNVLITYSIIFLIVMLFLNKGVAIIRTIGVLHILNMNQTAEPLPILLLNILIPLIATCMLAYIIGNLFTNLLIQRNVYHGWILLTLAAIVVVSIIYLNKFLMVSENGKIILLGITILLSTFLLVIHSVSDNKNENFVSSFDRLKNNPQTVIIRIISILFILAQAFISLPFTLGMIVAFTTVLLFLLATQFRIVFFIFYGIQFFAFLLLILFYSSEKLDSQMESIVHSMFLNLLLYPIMHFIYFLKNENSESAVTSA